MNKKRALITLIFLGIFIAPLISANDIGYIYKNEKKVDQNILDLFNKNNFTFELIQEKEINSKDLSVYGALFIGKENLKKNEKLNDYNLILMNKLELKNLGIVNKKLAKTSNSWRSSLYENKKKIEVYEKDPKKSRKKIPYQFILESEKNPSSVSIVNVRERSNENSGDLVNYIPKGSLLSNGKTSKNICFFGAGETNYWNEKAKNLFKNCVNFVLNSSITDERYHDVSFITLENSINNIAITTSNGSQVTEENPKLLCNQKYGIKVRIKNTGFFTENVSFKGNIGNLNFSHYTKNNLEQGEINIRTRNVNMTLAPGNYTINVEAIIPEDQNPEDNLVSRNIEIIC